MWIRLRGAGQRLIALSKNFWHCIKGFGVKPMGGLAPLFEKVV
jgi:hypothetical protein